MLLELDGRGPRYTQITRALLSLIHGGLLPPGVRLPGTRDLARDLDCSRNVVLLAYEQLVLEGYLVGRSKAGTFVSADLPRQPETDAAEPKRRPAPPLGVSPRGRALADAAAEARPITAGTTGLSIDFMFGVCTPDAQLARRLRASLAKAVKAQAFAYTHPAGDPGLRQQIADRLRGARGIVRSPEQIIITNGAQQALDICARLLVGQGDVIVVEDPGYAAVRAMFVSAGGTVIPVPVDRNGLDPAALPDDRRVRLAYVTPSHQFPTGAVMSASRRYALLAWARQRGACVIEDDYDGELRYSGRPIKALAALDGADHVVYCGTLAKSLFPSLRLGYLAVPEWLRTDAISAKWLADRGSSGLLQHAVRDLMATGEYDRHIARLRRRYSARRAILTRELRSHLGSEVEIAGDAAGLHLVVWTPNLRPFELEALVSECRRRSIGVYSVAEHAVGTLPTPGLILGYGLLDEDRLRKGIRGLAAAYQTLRKSARSRPRPTTADRGQPRLTSHSPNPTPSISKRPVPKRLSATTRRSVSGE